MRQGFGDNRRFGRHILMGRGEWAQAQANSNLW